MFWRKFIPIITPAITFMLGVFVQALFDQLINSSNIILLSLLIITISLVIIYIILGHNSKRLDGINNKLIEIVNRTGIKAEFVEDLPNGASYHKSISLVEKSEFNITIVSIWEPLPVLKDYPNQLPDAVTKARAAFYEAIKRQVSKHQISSKVFYQTIVQTPEKYKNIPSSIKGDIYFYDCLFHAADVQRHYPHSCRVRRSQILINTYFILIDNKHIIMPLFKNPTGVARARYGALFFEDSQGELVKYLQATYQTLDAHSIAISTEELKSIK
ncbi:MAG TPA: hypothetical protein VFV38_51690 [Ktedonobacteraceae bacterium]|nr:hypothetical protein [Ktedonobacteraceae bacterium]